MILGHRHRLLHVRALLAKRNRGESEIRSMHNGSLSLLFPTTTKRATPWASLREEARGQGVLHRQFAQEEVQKVLLGYPRPIHTRRNVPQEHA